MHGPSTSRRLPYNSRALPGSSLVGNLVPAMPGFLPIRHSFVRGTVPHGGGERSPGCPHAEGSRPGPGKPARESCRLKSNWEDKLGPFSPSELAKAPGNPEMFMKKQYLSGKSGESRRPTKKVKLLKINILNNPIMGYRQVKNRCGK